LQDLEGEEVFNGLVNGHFLKKYFVLAMSGSSIFVNIIFLLVFELIIDSIAQQQGTEPAKEFLASPMEPDVIT
jgi:hypothetical protein